MFKPIIGSVCFSNSFWSWLIINNAIFFIQEKKKQGKQSKKKQLKNKNKKREQRTNQNLPT